MQIYQLLTRMSKRIGTAMENAPFDFDRMKGILAEAIELSVISPMYNEELVIEKSVHGLIDAIKQIGVSWFSEPQKTTIRGKKLTIDESVSFFVTAK